MTGRRVAITGIGIVSSLGLTREATWARMLEGACGIGPVSAFDATGLSQPDCRRSGGLDS